MSLSDRNALCICLMGLALGATDTVALGGGSNCCAANGGLGCDDPDCQAAVCAIDPFCCDVAWDSICAGEAQDLCGDLCGGGGGPCGDPAAGDCCVANGTPGCSDAECCNTVCGVDPFCCDVTWDSICADEAADLCAELCGGGGCPKSGNDCCAAGSGPGCSNAECCAAVCATDSFCCEVEWDSICAGEAADFCGDLCDTGESNCCVPNGGLGCDDPACQAAVCAIDSFCCDVAWDGICADEAADLCAVCGGTGAPPNDDCVDRIDIGNGTTAFSNVNATTDGPSPCGLLGSDIWYNYTAECTGSVTIDTFGSPFDTVVAAYDGCECGGTPTSNCCTANGGIGCDDDACEASVCAVDPFCCDVAWDGICADEALDLCGDLCTGGGGALLACNDDSGGTLQSMITISVVEGNCYKLQLGGFNGAQGAGVINITKGDDCVAADPCEGSTNDCCVASPDGSPGCNNSDCCNTVCAVDPFCCDVAWDGICADEAQDLCADLCPFTCPSNPDDCCLPGDAPGCNDPECCEIVCDIDPFCCDVLWDGICAAEANDLCDVCQEVTLPLDIKPGSCPNPLNCNSNGVIPVAVLGTGDVSADSIDASTVVISRADGVGGSVGPNFGPPGPHPTIDDVATPFDGDLCDCHDENGDGVDDLVLHFKTQDVCSELGLGDVAGGTFVELVVSGLLDDGTPFTASDCVWIVPPGSSGPSTLAVSSTDAGVWIDTTVADIFDDAGGFADFQLIYPWNKKVTLIAPVLFNGQKFLRWEVNGQIAGTSTKLLVVTNSKQLDVVAVFGASPILDLD